MIVNDSFSRLTTRMIVYDSFSISPIAVRKHAAALFRREKFIRLQVCLTRRHLVFNFLRGKSLELPALVTLLARLSVNYHKILWPVDHVNDSW